MSRSKSEASARETASARLACAALAAFLGACGSPGPEPAADAGSVQPRATFTEVYSKVLQGCTNCHAGFVGQFNGLDVSTQAAAYKNLVGVSASRCTGTLVVAGDAAGSVLYQKVTSPQCGSRMPQNGPPLSQTNLALLKSWIDEGASND